jgi:hypothetical protein
MKAKQDLQKELEEKLRRLGELKARRPKKDCSHKEYSSPQDVAAVLEIEELEEAVSKLRAQLAK